MLEVRNEESLTQEHKTGVDIRQYRSLLKMLTAQKWEGDGGLRVGF